MALRIGVLESSMFGTIEQMITTTAKGLKKYVNISDDFVMLTSEELLSYDDEGYERNVSDIVMLQLGIIGGNFMKTYIFSTPVSATTSIIISGPPDKIRMFSKTSILPLQTSVWMALTIVTALAWIVNVLIGYVSPRKEPRGDQCSLVRILSDLLLMNSPLILKGVPHLNPRKLSSRVLFFTWLMCQTILSWNIQSYYSADASTTVYQKIEDLSDLGKHKTLQPKLMKDALEHRFFKLQNDSNLFDKDFRQKLKGDIFLDYIEILDEDLYISIAEKRVALLTNDELLLLASCHQMQFLPKGKYEFYFSTRPYLQVPMFYLLHRNISTATKETINRVLGPIFESRPFDYIRLTCKYIVYHQHAWEKPVDYNVQLGMDVMILPSLLITLSLVFGLLYYSGAYFYYVVLDL